MKPPITVIGLTAGGAAVLPTDIVQRILKCDLLAGGARHLSYFPAYAGETLKIGNNIPMIVDRLQRAYDDGQKAVVLASGDPLCYGIGTTLRRTFAPHQLEIIPAPGAFQLAFAALAEPWEDAALLSAHGRRLDDVIQHAVTSEKAAVLTDAKHTPQVIARALLANGVAPDARCAVCENLGSEHQRTVRLSLREIECHPDFASLNVFIIWNLSPRASVPPGLPDEAFTTVGGQITKREVRLLALAELGLGSGQVMWDIGAGSGSVGIEAARSQPSSQVYSIEQREPFCNHIQHNSTRHRTHNVEIVCGTAPGALHNLPDPDAVFIGGSGGYLEAILHHTTARLRPGGRLVVNAVTLENLATVRQVLPAAQVNQVHIQRGVPIADSLRFEALNPVFIVKWQKSSP